MTEDFEDNLPILILRLLATSAEGRLDMPGLCELVRQFDPEISAGKIEAQAALLEERGLVSMEGGDGAKCLSIAPQGFDAIRPAPTGSRKAWRSEAEGRPYHGRCPREWFALALYQCTFARGFDIPEQFEAISGIGPARLRDLVSALAEPTQKELVALREALNVSLDFLVAGLGIPTADGQPAEKSPLPYNCPNFEERLDKITRGEVEPTLDEMVALRDVLGSSLDFLVAGVGQDPREVRAEATPRA